MSSITELIDKMTPEAAIAALKEVAEWAWREESDYTNVPISASNIVIAHDQGLRIAEATAKSDMIDIVSKYLPEEL
jgi:hypothetical protein